MLDYKKVCNDLLSMDEFAITKIAIYYEIEYMVDVDTLTNDEIETIVDFIHDIYLNNDDVNYSYPMLVEYVADSFRVEDENGNVSIDTQSLLNKITTEGESFKEELIKNFSKIYAISF